MSNPIPCTKRSVRLAAAGALVAGISFLGAAPAFGHVSPDISEVPAGGYTDVRLGVGHGCEGSPTTKLEVQVPDLLVGVTPYVVPGWTAAVTTAKLDPPVKDAEGAEVTERDSVVTWTAQPGQELADGYKIQFGLSFQVPEKVGESLVFKTIQSCVKGSTEWIELTPAGGEEPEHPAPTVTIVAGTGEGHGDGGATTETTEAGATTTADGKDAAPAADDAGDDGGSNGLAIAGLVAGLAGLGLGGAAFGKVRKD